MDGDTHSLCVVCLRAEQTESALEGAARFGNILSLRMLYSRGTLFEEGAFTSFPHSAGPAFAEASQMSCIETPDMKALEAAIPLVE